MSRKSPEEKLEHKKQLWTERTAQILGITEEESESLLLSERRQSVRVNTLMGEKDQILGEMVRLGWKGDEFLWMENGYSIDAGREHLRDSELVKNGKIYIQNAASWLAVIALDPKPEEKILDVCAAPGGKTSHVAELTDNKANITANDNSRQRLMRLRANCERLGAKIDRYTLYDGKNIVRKLDCETYDKILLDAPCSGEGMMSLDRNKDFNSWSVAHIKRMQSLQKQIIRQAWQLLEPGGILVYSTCTMAPEENEAVIDYALKNLDDVKLLPIDIDLENRIEALESWNGKRFNEKIKGCLRLKPSKGIHAFFVAKLQKQ